MSVTYAPRRMTEKMRRAVLDAADACAYCGSAEPSEVDHVYPVSRGGSDDVENLAAACSWCNQDKSDLTVDEWECARLRRGKCWPPRTTTVPGAGLDMLAAACGIVADALGDDRTIDAYRPTGRTGEMWEILRAVRDGAPAETVASLLLRTGDAA